MRILLRRFFLTFAAAAILARAWAQTPANPPAVTLDAVSALIDWKFAPKWDTYIGTMYSQLNGGLDNGYLARNNWATTGGIRFRW